MVLPISRITCLWLPIKRKIGLVIMFWLSVWWVSPLCLVLRSQFKRYLDHNPSNQLHQKIPFNFALLWLWTILEPALEIINAHLPMTRSYLATVKPSKLQRIATKLRDRIFDEWTDDWESEDETR